jgi:branched-chain amino acid transport system ATP-binding protein
MGLLEVKNLSKSFGGLVANQHISLTIEEGETVGLIGPNGAGKTTLFNCIAGVYGPDEGRVLFKGEDITGYPPESVCRAGIARTFQLVKTFTDMTVLDNVMVGAFVRTSARVKARDRAMEVLEIAGLAGKRDALAAALTVADRTRLELARALATQPQLLLLDEVMAGLNPKETQEAVDLIRNLHEIGVTVFLVEHVMEAIMPISDRIVVLNYGKKLAEGPPGEIARSEKVIQAYLGEKYRAPS